jgi:acetyl esterase/lipase
MAAWVAMARFVAFLALLALSAGCAGGTAQGSRSQARAATTELNASPATAPTATPTTPPRPPDSHLPAGTCRRHICAHSDIAIWRRVPYTPPIRCSSSGATCRLRMDIYAPTAVGPWPTVLLLAGGPKAPGDQTYMNSAAFAVAARGAVVMAVSWREGAQYGGGWPTSFRDVGCAVGVARRMGPAYGARPDRVVLVGHSLGGWAAAVVGLSPTPFAPKPGQCGRTSGSLRPEAVVTLGGAVDEIRHQGMGAAFLDAFFHGTQAQHPLAWAGADPFALVDAARRHEVEVTLVRGGRDIVITPSSSPALYAALQRSGYRSWFVQAPRADHIGLLDAPRASAAITAATRRD